MSKIEAKNLILIGLTHIKHDEDTLVIQPKGSDTCLHCGKKIDDMKDIPDGKLDISFD